MRQRLATADVIFLKTDGTWHASCVSMGPAAVKRDHCPGEESVMLVLTRKAGEEIIIGEGIRVLVNKICGTRVRIGIDAPDRVQARQSRSDLGGGRTSCVL